MHHDCRCRRRRNHHHCGGGDGEYHSWAEESDLSGEGTGLLDEETGFVLCEIELDGADEFHDSELFGYVAADCLDCLDLGPHV